MLPAMSSTLSALGAFEKKAAVAADNIANVNTEGYRKKKALIQEGPNGTVDVEAQPASQPSEASRTRSANPEGQEPEGSDVALEEELPALSVSVYGFRANLKTLKAQGEMLGSLLDIVA